MGTATLNTCKTQKTYSRRFLNRKYIIYDVIHNICIMYTDIRLCGLFMQQLKHYTDTKIEIAYLPTL